MKIAISGPENEFTEALHREFGQRLPGDELLAWPPEAPAPANDIEVIISVGPVTRAQMQSQPQLALIQTASDGYETVDMDAATELGIWVSFSPGDESGNADSVAEYAVMLLIAACRRLGEEREFVLDHSKPRPLLNKGLMGKTVCIVGFGSIGAKLADRLRPFGVRLAAVDERPERVPQDVHGWPVEKTMQAVGEADAVVLCVRASAKTRHMVNEEFLGSMKRGAVLVNIARGSLVEEKALFDAVKSGQIGAAGLDVTETEPVDPKDPLLTLPQVFLPPPLAGCTDHTLEGPLDYLVKALNGFRDGKRFKSLLNTPGSPRRPLRD